MAEDPLFSQPLENLLPPEDPKKKVRAKVVKRAWAFRVPDTLQYAADRVSGPAIGMIVTASISGLLIILSLIFDVWYIRSGEIDAEPPSRGISRETAVYIRIAWGSLMLLADAVIVWGSIRMLSLRNLALCRIACTLSVVPCFGPCFILGIPFGVWGLKSLNDAEVRDAFNQGGDITERSEE